MKTPPSHAASQRETMADFGERMEAFKTELAAMFSALQGAWGEVSKEWNPGGAVTSAVKDSGLDETWSGVKKAAASVVAPWLTAPLTPVPKATRRRARSPMKKRPATTAAASKKKQARPKNAAAKKPRRPAARSSK